MHGCEVIVKSEEAGIIGLQVCSLASGSTGNATIVKTKETCILFDAGVSRKYIMGCLDKLKIDPCTLDSVFLSHEHTDHILGAGVISRSQKIPIRSNLGTWETVKHRLGQITEHIVFETEKPMIIKDLEILPIPVSHDAVEPVCFRIRQKQTGLQVGIVTDIGILTPPVKQYLQNSELLMLESNFDLDMLVKGTYPENVKLFILGELGHLSNREAGESLVELVGPKTQYVLLSHISRDNNTPELAYNTVSQIIGRHKIDRSILGLTYHNQMSKVISFA